MGIDPETLRLVAQCLQHYPTPVPLPYVYTDILNFKIESFNGHVYSYLILDVEVNI